MLRSSHLAGSSGPGRCSDSPAVRTLSGAAAVIVGTNTASVEDLGTAGYDRDRATAPAPRKLPTRFPRSGPSGFRLPGASTHCGFSLLSRWFQGVPSRPCRSPLAQERRSGERPEGAAVERRLASTKAFAGGALNTPAQGRRSSPPVRPRSVCRAAVDAPVYAQGAEQRRRCEVGPCDRPQTW